MKIAIVGHEADKFTERGKQAAFEIIRELLAPADAHLISGGCHLGGIDIWAEEIADELGRGKTIYYPSNLRWAPDGYELRNQRIAYNCNILHCLAVDVLAPPYKGMRFSSCYHCKRSDHVKGGGCWTMKQAKEANKVTKLWIIAN